MKKVIPNIGDVLGEMYKLQEASKEPKLLPWWQEVKDAIEYEEV